MLEVVFYRERGRGENPGARIALSVRSEDVRDRQRRVMQDEAAGVSLNPLHGVVRVVTHQIEQCRQFTSAAIAVLQTLAALGELLQRCAQVRQLRVQVLERSGNGDLST
jgi:hypothetical protein